MTDALSVSVAPHPLLHLEAVEALFPAGIGGLPPTPWLAALRAFGLPGPLKPW